MALIVAAAYARIIFLLKRHRLDDLRGRYRVWRTGSVARRLLVSANCVTWAHTIWLHAMGHLDRHRIRLAVTPPGGSCQVPSSVPGCLVRLILDAAECRTALAMFVAQLHELRHRCGLRCGLVASRRSHSGPRRSFASCHSPAAC